MKLCIIGAGYVGLVTAACFADLGNQVICVDNDKKKIQGLKKLIMPLYEPGLEEMVDRCVKERRLQFSTSIKEGVKNSEIIFIAVGTPSKPNGEADLTFVETVACQIAKALTSYRLIVEKSTVPVETGKWVEHTIRINIKKKLKFDVASNPEFLREGCAIEDFMHPDRIIIGAGSQRAEELLLNLYETFDAPIVITDIKTAELIKHACNSFLAAKISFINAVANICERAGADITKVAEAMGFDKRIGRSFLDSGIGYGGSCFPKDVDAFIHMAAKSGYEFGLLRAVKKINEEQRASFIRKIEESLWILKDKRIGILGLSFKPGTDDLRNAPSIDIINSLVESGAKIKAFDPQAMQKAKEIFKKIYLCKNPYEVAKDSDCLVVVTEWNEFKELDFQRIKRLLRQPLIIDGRNIYDPKKMQELGFRYISIGR